MNKEAIAETIKQKDIQWVQAHFTDILGKLRVLHFPAKRLIDDNLLENGFGFDGSSVGFSSVEKSDMLAIPDPSTFLVLPHEKDEARIISDIYTTNRQPYLGDPRNILKKAIKAAFDMGFNSVDISPEMEFHVFDDSNNEEYDIEPNECYFASPSLENVKNFRRDISEHLIQSGYQIKYHHHETGRLQHEVEIMKLDALSAADFCIYFKYLARELAKIHDFLITFMAKPLSDDAGSGLHAHLAFFNDGKNMFYDKDDKYNLSETARYFIGGVLDHSRGIAAIANPTLNSYKRLIPYFEAPIYIAWGQHNRSSLIRIAEKKDVDVEIRNADPSANPYLFYAAVIYAGLDGIKKKRVYDPIEGNIYQMSKQELIDRGIAKLPMNLNEALEALESDTVIKEAIGKEALDRFIQVKRKEWLEYMTSVTDLDYKFYFNC